MLIRYLLSLLNSSRTGKEGLQERMVREPRHVSDLYDVQSTSTMFVMDVAWVRQSRVYLSACSRQYAVASRSMAAMRSAVCGVAYGMRATHACR